MKALWMPPLAVLVAFAVVARAYGGHRAGHGDRH